MTKTKKHEFRPNDFVVYPAHGVGKIVSIEEQEIAGITLELFVISLRQGQNDPPGSDPQGHRSRYAPPQCALML